MTRILLPGIAALVLAGVICAELVASAIRPPPEPVSRPPAPPSDALAAGNTAGATDTRITEILSRPLFSPDRRPVETARGVAGLSRLSGIVVAGSRRLAIFAAAGGGRPVVAEEGSHIGTYEVRSITDNGVTVVGPNGAAVIRPIFDPAEPKPAPPPQPRAVIK